LSADISNNRFFVLYIQRHGLTPKKPTVSSWGYTPASDHLSQESLVKSFQGRHLRWLLLT